MELFADLNQLFEQLKGIIDGHDDISNLYNCLETIHFELIQRDLLNSQNSENTRLNEYSVISKLGFFILTKYSGANKLKCAENIEIKCFEVAAFCFEILTKSSLIETADKWEYDILSSICYTLADRQADSIVMARDALKKYSEHSVVIVLMILTLQRDFKKIARYRKPATLNRLDSNVFDNLKALANSMLRGNDHEKIIQELRSLTNDLRAYDTSYVFLYELFLLAIDNISKNSIRNLLSSYPNLKPYIDVLTQVDTKNVYELWQSQRIIYNDINKPVLSDENDKILISMPTSAGKTLIAELLIYNQLSKKNGVVIYVVPSIALTNEIENNLYKRFRKVGINVKRDVDNFDNNESTIYVLTPEKLDLLIRKSSEIMLNTVLVVFDEFHKISDSSRGWLLETLIAWFFSFQDYFSYKIIMMSAIIDNAVENIGNNDISIYGELWSPTRKLYGVYFLPERLKKVFDPKNVGQNEIIAEPFSLSLRYHYGYKKIPDLFEKKTVGRPRVQGKDQKRSDTKFDVCWKAICSINERPILIYFYRKDDIDSFIARSQKYCETQSSASLNNLINTIKKSLGKDHPLCSCLPYGVAFHTGDLPEDVRVSIENAYKSGIIQILACTTTLADGVNLPVSTLVLGSIWNHDFSRSISNSDYKNIVGRVGRALIDTEGKVFIIRHSDYYSEYVGQSITNFMNPDTIKIPLTSAVEDCTAEEISMLDTLCDIEELTTIEISETLRTILDRIQIFSFSMYQVMPELSIDEFVEIYTKSFFISKSQNTQRTLLTVANKVYYFASSIPQDFLYQCNSTGLSYGSNKKLSLIASKLTFSFSIFDIITSQIYTEILQISEFGSTKDLDHYGILTDWLKGASYLDIRNKYFISGNITENTRECTQYIREMFQYKLPWAFSALLVFCNGETKTLLSDLPQYVRYGTMSINAIELCTGGINSRELSISLDKAYQKNNKEALNISDWLVSISQYEIQTYLEKSYDENTLTQLSKFRSIHREKTTELETIGTLKCNIAGTTFHDYKRAYEQNLVQVGAVVLLEQDTNNPYDMYAVKVFTTDLKYQLGYVPAQYSEEVFDLIESGKELYGKILSCTSKGATMVIQ
ncbi:MAG: DEAD/DEAH box helicase [Oscillospiraceae bacterium]|nr:DEAD/DEAH box helicase [Oscillospiraceae bacterium]